MARSSSMILAAILLTWWPAATVCQSLLQVSSKRGQVAAREVAAAEESEQAKSQRGQVAASSSSATGKSDETSGCPNVLVVSSDGWPPADHRAMLGVYAKTGETAALGRPVYKSVRSSTEIHFVLGDWYIGSVYGYAWKSHGTGTRSCPTDWMEWVRLHRSSDNTGRTIEVSQLDHYLTVEAQGPIPSGLWYTAVPFPCTWSDGCVRSPHYPSVYRFSEACSIDINPAESISIEAVRFETEMGFDVLNINGIDYDGFLTPFSVVPTGSIQWTSDSTGHNELGWELCPVRTGCTSTRHSNAAISGNNREHLTGFDPDGCTRACCSRSWCKTFDYYKNTRQCDLSDTAASDVGGLKTNYAGNPYDHYVVRG